MPHVVYPFICRWTVGLLPPFAIVNDGTMNIGYKDLFELLFNYVRYAPGMGIAGSDGNFMFNFLRNCGTIFHNGCTTLHSHQQSTKVPIFFPFYQPLVHSGLESSSQYSHMFAILLSILGLMLMIIKNQNSTESFLNIHYNMLSYSV